MGAVVGLEEDAAPVKLGGAAHNKTSEFAISWNMKSRCLAKNWLVLNKSTFFRQLRTDNHPVHWTAHRILAMAVPVEKIAVGWAGFDGRLPDG